MTAPSLPILSLCLALAFSAGARADTVTISDEQGTQGPLYRIEGTFDVDATRAQVWDVLTDYSALKGVVSSMQASCVLSRDAHSVVVEQVALGRFLFFRRSIRLLLNVQETPPAAINFSAGEGAPFRVYNGSWDLQEKGAAVTVTYRLNVSQGDMAPAFVERGLFRDNALTLLQELKAEIVRRAALPAPKEKNGP